jgi:hypothetical protein
MKLAIQLAVQIEIRYIGELSISKSNLNVL